MKRLFKAASVAAFAVSMSGAWVTAHATIVSLGNVLANGAFGSALSTGWTSAGVAAIRSANDPINASVAADGGGNATFDGFFGTRFAVLGDSAGFISPVDPASEAEGTHLLSQAFTLRPRLPQGDVVGYRLSVYFRVAFDGRDGAGESSFDFFDAYPTDPGGDLPGDVFDAYLSGPGGELPLFSMLSQGLGACGPAVAPNCTDAQQTIDRSRSAPLVFDDLLPGAYSLTFRLHEAPGGGPDDVRGTQTAAGIDDVRVVAAARIPEPASVLLVAAGALGLTRLDTRRLRRRVRGR